MFDPKTFFEPEIFDLGEHLGAKFSGIYAPRHFLQEEKIGVGKQFMASAESYHKMSFNPEKSKNHLRPQLAKLSELSADPIILDVGAGSGNTVFADWAKPIINRFDSAFPDDMLQDYFTGAVVVMER